MSKHATLLIFILVVEQSEKDEETDTTDGIPTIRLRKKRKAEDIEQRKESSQKQSIEQPLKVDAYSYGIEFF